MSTVHKLNPDELEREARGDSVWNDPEPLPQRRHAGNADFPVDLLPEPIQDAAREVARFVKAPLSASALVGLSSVATAIGKRAVVEERAGLKHYPALFLAGIAASGERKSPVFRLMTYPLEEWAEFREEAWKEASRKAKARNSVIDHAIQVARRKAKSAGSLDTVAREVADLEAERMPVPPHPRLFTTDTTEQRVIQLMHERHCAFSVMSGEGRPVLDAIMGKYSGHERTGDAVYLAGISGDTITRDRVGGEEGPESRVIRSPCLNVCILVQPDKYLEAASHRSLRESGALARIWPVWMPSMVGRRIEAVGETGLDAGKMADYNKLIYGLLNHEPPEDAGRPMAHTAVLSTDATEARRVFHNSIETMMGDGGDLGDCKDIASKAVSQTCKMALCLHLASDCEAISQPNSQISQEIWQNAQSIGLWFLNEAIRVQRMADEDPVLESARRVLDWLARTKRKSVTGSNLTQYAPRPRPKAKEASAILELLADHGYLQPENNPRARRPVYAVHPEISQFSQGGGVK